MVKSFEELQSNLSNSSANYKRDTLTKVFNEIVMRVNEIDQFLETRIQDMWPDIFLYLIMGSKPVAICKLNAVDFTHSQSSGFAGIYSRMRRTMAFKSINCTHTCQKCGCLFANLEGWIWIGLESERSEVLNHVGWMSTEEFYYTPRDYTMYNCKVFIYQAKIRPGSDKGGLCDPKIRVTFIDCLSETSVIRETLSPVWNEVIKMKGICIPGTSDWFNHDPPIVAIEIFDEDAKNSVDYIGCTLLKMLVGSKRKKNEDPGRMEDETQITPRVTHKSLRDVIASKMSSEKLKDLKKIFPPSLQWISLVTNGVSNAELLVSAEILEVGVRKSDDPPVVSVVPGLPTELVPTCKRHKYFSILLSRDFNLTKNPFHRVEVMFAGLRNCQKISFNQISGKYKIKILIGDLQLFSGLSDLKIKNSILFSSIYVAGIVTLPEQLEYWPPIFVNHLDCSRKNQEISIGAALIANTSQFLDETGADGCKEEDTILNVGYEDTTHNEKTILLKKDKLSVIEMIKNLFKRRIPKSKDPSQKDDEDVITKEYTWWTKFYNSTETSIHIKSSQKSSLVVYQSELENQAEFSHLQDWAVSVPLVKGIKNRKNANAKEEVYGILRCQIRIKPCESRLTRRPSVTSLKSFKSTLNTKFQGLDALQVPLQVVIRVYIVQGINLRAADVSSPSDAFVKLQLGQMKISDRANYCPNETNPIFGKRFQFDTIIPRDHNLHISVYDKGRVNDDLIGSTIIDLEDRLRSKHLPCVGIPKIYNKSGYNIWRHPVLPTEILEDICRREGVKSPEYQENEVVVQGKVFTMSVEDQENKSECLALYVLNRLDEVPGIDYKLVPEHVETRNLYRKEKPGLSQVFAVCEICNIFVLFIFRNDS